MRTGMIIKQRNDLIAKLESRRIQDRHSNLKERNHIDTTQILEITIT